MSGMYQYLTQLKPIRCICELMRSNGQRLSDIGSEAFSKVTLQQLCRPVIRQQLREPSLGGNLRNFRRKISELPLPNLLKDFLLFKN